MNREELAADIEAVKVALYQLVHPKEGGTMTEQPIASQDWHTRAIVRMLKTTRTGTPDGGRRTFWEGQEYEMLQWGRAGRPIDRSRWWSSFDIDGAHIVKSDNVEIVNILDEVAPIESK